MLALGLAEIVLECIPCTHVGDGCGRTKPILLERKLPKWNQAQKIIPTTPVICRPQDNRHPPTNTPTGWHGLYSDVSDSPEPAEGSPLSDQSRSQLCSTVCSPSLCEIKEEETKSGTLSQDFDSWLNLRVTTPHFPFLHTKSLKQRVTIQYTIFL